ncbi:MBL fold metallo-hydrolase [Salicibibacter cibarius]|uniref:MBL fold metallo-hydrolase n=1 Tax=Salicibibacter cibarius TaxID=2743000 RepID=A0A7T7CA80_9BACI|nr:MBL fold metallo-hydrolase [Salicibibacter cibarius]QQK74585.1 MBL fold metallo-hydrolase [Salicibibacter cibarius]
MAVAIHNDKTIKKSKHDQVEIIKISVNPYFPLISIYLYYIDGMLIDTGPSKRRRRLIPLFRSWDLERVAITHYHEDHSGMASWIARNTPAEIFVHEKTIPIAEKTAQVPWYQEFFTGRRLPFSAKAYPNVIETSNYRFYPIETPGHTDDHICIFEPYYGWLFTGDLYITPCPKVFLEEESMAAYIETLHKLNRFDYQTVFCAHEGVIRNGKEMMNRKLEYLERTRDEVVRMHRMGWKDRTIMKKLFPDKVKLEQRSFGTFSRLNMIRSCIREQ